MTPRLKFHLYNSLCTLRISEMFDIIVDFPDSRPAVDDIKEWYANRMTDWLSILQLIAAMIVSAAWTTLICGLTCNKACVQV